ncbi:MAG: AmmeMemoRadiSam system protein A [Defluviitaleaceae bacterium]|nr:AmmeMemoRadiSam system protein A [Defluviitaleaceae bacterium]
MAIISAYVMPHPPLAVPQIGNGKEGVIPETINAMEEIGAEIARQKPDTIIYISPHAPFLSEYFNISDGAEAKGDFGRFGVVGASYKTTYDTALAQEIIRSAEEAEFPAGVESTADKALDHGMLVPMHYINKHFSDYKSVRVALSELDAEAHFNFGKLIAAAIDNLGTRTVIIASGDLSHKLSESGPYGLAPEGIIFDREVMHFLSDGDFKSLLAMDSTLREKAAECGFGSFAILAGCLHHGNITAKQLSYECPFGVGYGVVSFTIEDNYRSLARRSLEYRIKTGQMLPCDKPDVKKAGVFVSLHKDGELRGCIGTISPTKESISEEIIQNAVSAGIYDHRFPPVNVAELPYLTYKVDILDEPEDITDADQLDVKNYGVIVESGFKRGLLLPNLEGVDTVEYQLDIACQKAGIAKNEPYKMKRFKVTRYE